MREQQREQRRGAERRHDERPLETAPARGRDLERDAVCVDLQPHVVGGLELLERRGGFGREHERACAVARFDAHDRFGFEREACLEPRGEAAERLGALQAAEGEGVGAVAEVNLEVGGLRRAAIGAGDHAEAADSVCGDPAAKGPKRKGAKQRHAARVVIEDRTDTAPTECEAEDDEGEAEEHAHDALEAEHETGGAACGRERVPDEPTDRESHDHEERGAPAHRCGGCGRQQDLFHVLLHHGRFSTTACSYSLFR